MTASALDSLDLDPAQYAGGVGIWGALPAVYDTTRLPVEHGVHVHARHAPRKKKAIDTSYGEVRVALGSLTATLSETNAMPFVVGAVLGLPMREIACPYCGELHLDTARFAVRPHDLHLCAACEKEFLEPERAIGNPIIHAQRLLGATAVTRPTKPGSPGPVRLDQGDPHLAGGINIWASNPAILWTAQREEADGIHVHAYAPGISDPIVDETYQRVQVDGIELDVDGVRLYMVQQSFPHLRDSVSHLRCPKCGADHFDSTLPFAVEPHCNHRCAQCAFLLVTEKPQIGNPFADVLTRLYANAAKAGLSKNPLAP